MNGVPNADLDFSYHLEGAGGTADFFGATAELLTAIFPCDGVAWNYLDLERQTAVLRGTPHELEEESTAALLAHHAPDHPIIQSYLHSTTAQPRRLSDVASHSDLLRNGSYIEVMRPLRIRYQLSVMTVRSGQLTGGGWALSSESTDFTNDHVVLAGRIQQVLSLLESPSPVTALGLPGTQERLGVTDREMQVLALVAEGHTAHAIGSLLRISPATVRKHLQQLYAKLGVSDRLVAVRRAQQIGLLATIPAPRSG